MKRSLSILVLIIGCNFGQAQGISGNQAAHQLQANINNQRAAQDSANAAAAAAQAEKDRKDNAPPHDPWRVVDEKRVSAKGKDWIRFWGKVERIDGKDMVMIGHYQYDPDHAIGGEFIVRNFPWEIVDGEAFAYEGSWWAKDVGVGKSGSRTLKNFDYEKVWFPEPVKPLTAEEKQAQKEAQDAKRIALLAPMVERYRVKAEAGDAEAEEWLGEHYRDGVGVPQDSGKARSLFSQSAAQGNAAAKKALTRLAE